MNVHAPVVELESTLCELVPTLDRLCELLGEQRQAVAAGDLARLLTVTGEQEEASARLTHLEQRRDRLQTELEEEFGVHGLREIARAGLASDTRREEFLAIVHELLRASVRLHQETERASALLTTAVEVSPRTRAFLATMDGLLSVRSSIGAKLNRLDTAEVRQQSLQVGTARMQAETEAADYAEEITRLIAADLAYKAGLQAAGKAMRQSLFDYPR